ncbi:armadillo beta-catenin plakoglobin [Auriculariales sp. MPI-PUGE-AT-0066]|nr:armadillo beta-catenin plakoglobin [Auriculariales sp. MPI-PUGE-AT-0066]
MSINVVDHPIIASKLSILRQKSTPPTLFRQTVHDISLLLGYEASRSLPTKTFAAESPVAPFTVALAPIMRAGIGMTDALLALHPDASKVSLQPLPDKSSFEVCFVLDPMVATAGTASAALNMIKDSGVPITNIKFIAIVASESGLKTLLAEFPQLEVWTAAVDPELVTHNGEAGKIKPGLGDAGDRFFQTFGQ